MQEFNIDAWVNQTCLRRAFNRWKLLAWKLEPKDLSALVSYMQLQRSRSQLSYPRLRAACRCAECASVRRETGNLIAGINTSTLNRIAPVSDTGLQLHFSDGHERDIFRRASLRELSEPVAPTDLNQVS